MGFLGQSSTWVGYVMPPLTPHSPDLPLPNSPFPRGAMAANLVHCGIESGRKQNNGCWGYCEKNKSMT